MSSIVLSIFLLSIGASFIQRTTGFGFGIFIMTMLPFLMPSYGEATTLSGLLAITTSAAIVWRLRSYVTWQRLWPILLTFIIVSTIAIFALTRIEDHMLRRILGVALILISIYFMLFSQNIKLPTTKKLTGILPDEPLGIPSEQPSRWIALGAAMAIQENGTSSLDYFAMLRGWEMCRQDVQSGKL